MIIIIDTREKDEYSFGDIVTLRSKLEAGDYSVAGLEDRISIERKELDDFVSTVIYQKDRFHNELCALACMEYAAIVVEASLPDIIDHRYKSAVLPKSVIGAVVAVMMEYRIPIIFAGNRQIACHLTESILRRFSDKHERQRHEDNRA